jgi:hypothetical protein
MKSLRTNKTKGNYYHQKRKEEESNYLDLIRVRTMKTHPKRGVVLKSCGLHKNQRVEAKESKVFLAPLIF